MSRSLGLREDQRVGEVLATRIAGLFPLDRGGRICGQLLLQDHAFNVGARPARDMRPEQSPKIQTLGIVAIIEGR